MTSHTPHHDTTTTDQETLTQRHAAILMHALFEIAVNDPTVTITSHAHYLLPPDGQRPVTVWTTAESIAGFYAAGVQINDMTVTASQVDPDRYRAVNGDASYAGITFTLRWVEQVPQ